MATIIPRRNPADQLIGYQVKVRFRGRVHSRTFRRKADAERWGRETETDIERGVFVDRTLAERTTLETCLKRYRDEATPSKKGARREQKRIAMWLRDPLAKRTMASFDSADFAEWIARRGKRGDIAKSPAANTIRLDLALIRHLFEVARQRAPGTRKHADTLRRPFVRHVEVTPAQYRKRRTRPPVSSLVAQRPDIGRHRRQLG
jgi:hypothetical protein